MFEAVTISTGEHVRLERSKAPGGRLIGALEAQHNVTDLTCNDPHCDGGLVYRRGGDTRSAHWAHARDTASDCAASGGPEGEWHQHIKMDVLGACAFHERSITGARVDAVREHISGKGVCRLYGIEVQHSPITQGTMDRRHSAHQAAGLACTLWLANASLLRVDARSWTSLDVQPANHTETIAGAEMSMWLTTDPLATTLLADAFRWCDFYPVSVGFLLDTGDGQGQVLRLARRIVASQRTGQVRIGVTEWSAPIDEATLRGWAGATIHHPVLNALHSAKVNKPEDVRRAR